MFGDFDLNSLMQQAQQLQADMERAQEEVLSQTFTASSGGDLVSVVLSGKGDLQELTIKPEAVDPDDTETLADLIIAAYRSAREEADDAMKEAMPNVPQIPGFGG